MSEKGDYDAAEPLFRRALAINERALGPEHPVTATSLNNLSALLSDKGDYDAAEPLYHRALAIRERALGPEHPDTMRSLKTLRRLLVKLGRFSEAELLRRRKPAIAKKTCWSDNRIHRPKPLHTWQVGHKPPKRW